MKNYLIFPILLSLAASLSAQSLNVEVLGQVNRGDIFYSGSWYYVGDDDTEYALIGTRTGVAANVIDDASLPEVGFVSGPESNWREITVIGNHAFVTTEGTGPGEGMQVIDLNYLPDSLHLLTTYSYVSDSIPFINKGHIIQRNNYVDESYVYVNGGCGTCGVQIIDVSDPMNPTLVGEYQPGYYIHDCFVKDDRIYACAFFESTIDVVDISDKANPTLMTTIPDPGSNTHSVWLTEDDRHLVICDEANGLPARIMNVEDIENPFVESPTYTADDSSLVHNPYIRGDYVFFAHNSAGLTIVDIRDARLPVEVGNFDTWDGPSGTGGLWSACPFPPSGKIIGGDRGQGLFVWTFNNTQAGRFYGVVKDSITGDVLMNAAVVLQPNGDLLVLDFDGAFKYGSMATSGLVLEAVAAGYDSKSISFDLLEGDSLWFEIELVPEGWVPPVSVFDLNSVPDLAVFPNPSSGDYNIDLSSLATAKSIEVFEVDGKLVLNQNIEGLQQVKLDLGDKATGVYLIRVLDEELRALGVGEVLKY